MLFSKKELAEIESAHKRAANAEKQTLDEKQHTMTAFQTGVTAAFALLQLAMQEWPPLCVAAGVTPVKLPIYKKRLFGKSTSEPFYILFSQVGDRHNEKAGLLEHSIGVNAKGHMVHITEEHISVRADRSYNSEFKSFYRSSRLLEDADALHESERAFWYMNGGGLMRGDNTLKHGVPRIGTLLGAAAFEFQFKSGYVGMADHYVSDAYIELWVDHPRTRENSLMFIKNYMLERITPR